MDEIISTPLLVRDLMTVGVQTCAPDTPAPEIARLLAEKYLEAVVVLDLPDGHAVGVVSQDELVRALNRADYLDLKAKDILRDGVPQAPADIPVTAAAQIMQDQQVRVLFLMHHSGGVAYPAGLISYIHLLRYFGARDRDDLKDLGINAERKSPVEAFIERRNAARQKLQGKKL